MHRSSLEFLILTLSSGCVSLDSLILTLCIWFEKRTGGAGRSGICCDNLQAQNMMLNVGPPQLRGFERSQHGSSWPCPSERANERREPGRVEFAWLWRRAKRESSRVSSTLHVPSPLDGLHMSLFTPPRLLLHAFVSRPNLVAAQDVHVIGFFLFFSQFY